MRSLELSQPMKPWSGPNLIAVCTRGFGTCGLTTGRARFAADRICQHRRFDIDLGRFWCLPARLAGNTIRAPDRRCHSQAELKPQVPERFGSGPGGSGNHRCSRKRNVDSTTEFPFQGCRRSDFSSGRLAEQSGHPYRLSWRPATRAWLTQASSDPHFRARFNLDA